MEDLFLTLLNRSISAGWLILAVMALRLLLKRGPRWAPCLLWAVVGLRLICPFSLQSVWSLIPSAQTLSPDTVRFDPSPTIHSGVAVIDRTVNPVLQGSFAAEPWASVNPLYVWLFIASILWSVGVAALVLFALVSYLRTRRRVAEAVWLRENIWLCDGVASPFILGVLRPRIYLPAGLAEADTACVLAHERAHLRRGDHWWKLLGYALLAVYWFHPLVWAAYALFCRDLELACDERVVRDLDMAGKKAYSAALLACAVGRRPVFACPLAFGEVGVKERVRGVLRYKKPAVWMAAVAVILCAAVAVCFLTDPQAAETGTAGGDDTPPVVESIPPAVDYGLYDALIARARGVLENRDSYTGEEPFSSVFYQHWDYETLGYLRRDLDGDGVEELMFGANTDGWDNGDWDGIVYDLYTIRDGAVVHVLDGWERSQYFLCENGCVAHEGSNSAFESSYEYYRYQDGALTLVEAVIYDANKDPENPWFYTTAFRYDPTYNEPILAGDPISEEEAQSVMAQYVHEHPKFTPFAEA